MKKKIAVYIHIPFCRKICPYCDFCKVYYQKMQVESYLHALEQEIRKEYHNEVVKSIYIGGGTPSCLTVQELDRLLTILERFKKDEKVEYTIECNIEDVTLEKIKLFQKYGLNRISIGIQTSIPSLQEFVDRKIDKNSIQMRIKLLKDNGFSNLNVDLMYALKGETLEELQKDLDFFLSLDVAHISTYSLMIEPHTKFYLEDIKELDQELDAQMYELICKTLKEHGYCHYEVSNFSKKGYESRHNLSYWSNEEYYGFGAGASFYYQNKRGRNTRNVFAYINGNFQKNIEVLKKEDKMDYFVLLGFRKKEGISKKKFKEEFSCSLKDVYSFDKWICNKILKETASFIYLDEKYFYVMNKILVEVLSSRK